MFQKPLTSALSLTLIFQLTLLPLLPALAQEKTSSSSSSKKTVVIELRDAYVKPKNISEVTESLRQALIKRGKLDIVSKADTDNFLGSHPDILTASVKNPLERYVSQAQEFYQNFSFKDAYQLLENALSAYRESASIQQGTFRLADAYALLGNIYIGAKNEKKAIEAFTEAMRLDPELMITEREYAPSVVELFKKTRKEYLARVPSSELVIQSSVNKSQVYVNGVLKGQTPLKLDPWPQGEHFVYVEQSDYRPEIQKVTLGEQGAQSDFQLTKKTQNTLNMQGLYVNNTQDVPELVRIATAVGQAMQVNKVILVNLEERGWNQKITARMIDLKYQASYKPESVEILDLSEDTPNASAVLAKNLEQTAEIDLAKDPAKYAEGDVLVLGKRKKKSILKSPLLWSLVGVVVAGGAASAFLIPGGGGGTVDPGTLTNINGSVKGSGK